MIRKQCAVTSLHHEKRTSFTTGRLLKEKSALFLGGYKSSDNYVYVRGRGAGRYVCDLCGIRCKKPSMLRKHLHTHTDVRPHHCKVIQIQTAYHVLQALICRLLIVHSILVICSVHDCFTSYFWCLCIIKFSALLDKGVDWLFSLKKERKNSST